MTVYGVHLLVKATHAQSGVAVCAEGLVCQRDDHLGSETPAKHVTLLLLNVRGKGGHNYAHTTNLQ